MKHYFLFFITVFFLQAYHISSAQPVSISGIINTYTPVISIDTTGCNDMISVADATGFSMGDTVMIIQMKGATIDSSNTSSFGDVTDFGNAGNYEFTSVSAISANQITISGVLQYAYTPAGYVQLIRVPVYSDADVTSTLLPKDWDGSTGGVLVFFVSDTLYLDADIDASGNGFRGGAISNNPDGGCGNNNINGYYYDLYQGGYSWLFGGAEKGEGIAVLSSSKMGGRGKLANGGGGGNKHNTGGGGGSNYTTGGKGGNELQGCIPNGNGGIGGAAMPYNLNKIFPGGGGGCGDFNNGVGSVGVDGGGIIIIKAKYLIGNSNNIIADGLDELVQGGGIADGVGGGGGGGAIFLVVNDFTSSSLALQADGGDGGDQGIGNYYGCAGTGGGGGTGVIFISGTSLPANVTTEVLPGVAGIVLNSAFPCYNTTYGATNGSTAPSNYLTGLTLPYSLPPCPNQSVFFASSDTTICEKFCLDFFDQSINNPTSWLWLFPGASPATSTDQNPIQICYNLPGTYDVTLITSSATGSDTLTLTNYITVYATPAFPTITQNGYVLTSSFANAYQWQLNSADIPGATNQSYTVTQSGYYTVIISDENGCQNSFGTYVLIEGIDDSFSEENISVLPNPSNGDFEIQCSPVSNLRQLKIDVVNTLGEKVFSSTEQIFSSTFLGGIHLTNVPDGIYFIRLKSESSSLQMKLLVVK
ncbi:MAG TPA: T9SS type A sorting domain-containing protein [Chitinophagales bacterium]|nr:T9SS type A sorting domain-containing protein [Chitinophagales bacterium]